MLLLTGLRLNEAAQLSWPEVQGNIIIIPAERMKGQGGQGGRTSGAVVVGDAGGHRVAAAHQGRASSCSRLAAGKRPLSMTGPIKADLDKRMLRTLQGDGPPSRRGSSQPSSCRGGSTTICAARSAPVCRHLRVPHNVAEAVLAHRQGGIVAHL